jgi:hypothetical protein
MIKVIITNDQLITKGRDDQPGDNSTSPPYYLRITVTLKKLPVMHVESAAVLLF